MEWHTVAGLLIITYSSSTAFFPQRVKNSNTGWMSQRLGEPVLVTSQVFLCGRSELLCTCILRCLICSFGTEPIADRSFSSLDGKKTTNWIGFWGACAARWAELGPTSRPARIYPAEEFCERSCVEIAVAWRPVSCWNWLVFPFPDLQRWNTTAANYG